MKPTSQWKKMEKHKEFKNKICRFRTFIDRYKYRFAQCRQSNVWCIPWSQPSSLHRECCPDWLTDTLTAGQKKLAINNNSTPKVNTWFQQEFQTDLNQSINPAESQVEGSQFLFSTNLIEARDTVCLVDSSGGQADPHFWAVRCHWSDNLTLQGNSSECLIILDRRLASCCSHHASS